MYHVGVTTFSLGLWEMCSVWYPTSYKKTLIWPGLFGEIILIILFQKLNFNTRLVTCAYSKTAVNPLTHGTYHMRPFTTKCSLLHSRFESLSLFHLSCGGDYSQHVFFSDIDMFLFFSRNIVCLASMARQTRQCCFRHRYGCSRTTFVLFSDHFFLSFLEPLFLSFSKRFYFSRTTFCSFSDHFFFFSYYFFSSRNIIVLSGVPYQSAWFLSINELITWL